MGVPTLDDKQPTRVLRVIYNAADARYPFSWEIRGAAGDLIQSPKNYSSREDALAAGENALASMRANGDES